MKKFKILSIFMVMICLFALAFPKTTEALMLSGYYDEVYLYNETSLIRQFYVIRERSVNLALYCLDMGNNLPHNNSDMTRSSTPRGDSKTLAYIIKNAPSRVQATNANKSGVMLYGGTTLTTGIPNEVEEHDKTNHYVGDEDYTKAQLAIWSLVNSDVYNSISSQVKDIYTGIDSLVRDAQSDKNTLNEITVTVTGDNSMTLSSDGTTYESGKLTITSSQGGNITLSLVSNNIEGIKIYNVDGQEITNNKIPSGSEIIVKVPSSSIKLGNSTFKIDATGTGEKYEVYEYTAENVQKVGRLEFEIITDTKPIEFSIEKKSTTKFSKISVVNQKELPGATLRILDENKEPLMDPDGKPYEWVSTDEPHYIEGLPAGKYYLQELIAPEGYVLSDEIVEFEVKEDGSITEVIMENDLQVEVPDTLSSRSILLLVIGMIDIALGIGILLYVKKNKATE